MTKKEINPLISVVLPTYNVAQYLQQCLESVAAQTYRNIEVIIIIDGTTDGSYEIAQEFSKTDSRFSVYWQENAGSGPARNAGLTHCNGEFVMFVDPDDWIEPELLENLYDAQRQGDYDLVASERTFALCNKDGEIVRIVPKHYKKESYEDQQEVRQAFMRMLEMLVVSNPTQKLYKLSLIREHDIQFPDLRRSQDIVFNYRYYNHISSLCLIEYSGYNYRKNFQASIGKVEYDYYKTIVLLYNDYMSLYQMWSLPFPEQKMADWFLRTRLNSYLQKMVGQKLDYREAVANPVISKIIQTSRPKKMHLRITRRLLLSKSYTLLNYFLTIILIIKRNHIRN
jgi:glycosyltransferase EpsJ